MLAIGVVVLIAVLARRVESFWQHLKQGVAIFRQPRRYLREVARLAGGRLALRFASFWLFLDAFHIGGSFDNVLLVMSVQAITGALPFTPGGAGAQQALLVVALDGPDLRRRARLLGRPAGRGHRLVGGDRLHHPGLVFRAWDLRRLIREGRAARGETKAAADLSPSRTRPGSACP